MMDHLFGGLIKFQGKKRMKEGAVAGARGADEAFGATSGAAAQTFGARGCAALFGLSESRALVCSSLKAAVRTRLLAFEQGVSPLCSTGCGRDLSVAFCYIAMQGSSSGGSIVVTQQGCVLVRAFNAQILAWPRDAALLLPRCTR